MKETVFKTLNALFESIYHLLILHFLWMTGTALGGVIIGIGPSTAALFSVLRRGKLKDDKEIVLLFKDNYVSHFKSANVLFLSALIMGSVIVLNIVFLMSVNHAVRWPLLIILILTAYIYVCSLTILLPIHIHFDIGLKKVLEFSVKIGLAYSLRIVSILIIIGGTYFFLLVYAIPLLILFGITPAAYLTSKLSQSIFHTIEKLNSEEERTREIDY